MVRCRIVSRPWPCLKANKYATQFQGEREARVEECLWAGLKILDSKLASAPAASGSPLPVAQRSAREEAGESWGGRSPGLGQMQFAGLEQPAPRAPCAASILWPRGFMLANARTWQRPGQFPCGRRRRHTRRRPTPSRPPTIGKPPASTSTRTSSMAPKRLAPRPSYSTTVVRQPPPVR